jgi:RNA polymerase sigma-70 factor (ECF subfamily)
MVSPECALAVTSRRAQWGSRVRATIAAGWRRLGNQRSTHGREDWTLLDALRRGDDDAFARLVAEHHASLRRVARLYVANAAIADEVVQDTWVGVIRGIWAFEGRSSIKTWIFRILVNRARTRGAREGRSPSQTNDLAPETVAESDWAAPTVDPGSSPEQSLLTKELGERLRTVIHTLPSNLKTVLWLRDVEGWSSEDVCNALAIQETNQRVLLHRARSRARAALEPYLEAPPPGRGRQMTHRRI